MHGEAAGMEHLNIPRSATESSSSANYFKIQASLRLGLLLGSKNFRKGVVLVDCTHGKIELPSQKGGSGGISVEGCGCMTSCR